MTAPSLSALRRRLLAWFDRRRRDLPWRRTRDPWAILVSEIMLQQTRAAVVESRFEAFLDLFPDPDRLARTDDETLHAAWAGLGYYRRARNLRDAARAILARHGGRVPSDPEALSALPGVGPYTAGAVASIAFGRRVPAVDGNVERVLVRLFGWRGDPRRAPLRRRIRDRAAQLVPPGRPGDFNQALMELGALVCLPRTPRCEACPLRSDCIAAREGRASDLPERNRRADAVEVEVVCALVRRRGRVLLVERPAGGLLAGLLDLPQAAGPGARSRLARALASALGRLPALDREVGRSRHSITRHRIRARLLLARTAGASAVAEGAPSGPPHPLDAAPPAAAPRWATLDELEDLPLATLAKKLLRAAGSI